MWKRGFRPKTISVGKGISVVKVQKKILITVVNIFATMIRAIALYHFGQPCYKSCLWV